jgi:hypothetical protein
LAQEPDQQIAGARRLIVGNGDLDDKTGDFRRNHGHVAADIGVVGALDEPANCAPLMAV